MKWAVVEAEVYQPGNVVTVFVWRREYLCTQITLDVQ